MVRGTSQTGVAWALGMNNTRGSTSPNPTPDLSNRSTDLYKTLGIVGTPHGESIAKLLSTKACQIKRNRRNPAKNSSNLRTPKTPKIKPLYSRIWEGNQREKNHEGFTHTPPPNPQENGLKISPRKSLRKGSENHQKERTRTTHPSLEEPRRIIYTSQRGSYKV
jgi:hypothetical protein